MSVARILLLAFLCGRAFAGDSGSITIDSEEWLDQPVRHLYIHGVWKGNTRFRICLPAQNAWKRRILQYLAGGTGGSENSGRPDYALSRGAVYVESSQGHIGPAVNLRDHTAEEASYEASYAVVQYAKIRCAQLYGKEATYTYVTGSSNGGVRTTGLLERFPKAYDGGVPVVGAGNMAFFNYKDSLTAAYGQVIRPRGAALDDAIRPGGSGKLFDVLRTQRERQALEAILRTGFPRNSIWLLGLQPMEGSVGMMDIVKYEQDPDYFEDFWTTAGYAGADGKCKADQVEGVVKASNPKTLLLTTNLDRPNNTFDGYSVVFTTGAAEGRSCTVLRNNGPDLIISSHAGSIDGVQPGDRFALNNRDLLAWQWFYRYILDVARPLMDEFVITSEPHYSQRPLDKLRATTEPDRPMGHFRGKMIAVFGGDDPFTPPSLGIRYHRYVRAALGPDIDNHFRIHFIEHAWHGFVFEKAYARILTLDSATRKALDDLMGWVENGTPPPPGTQYSLDSMNQLVFPKSAAERKGYQPVVQVSAAGKTGRIEVASGKEVAFLADAEDPDNEVARLEMDFEGGGQFDEVRNVNGKKAGAEFRHRYDKPGTYFATVRVTDSSDGGGIQNLAAIRVVVK